MSSYEDHERLIDLIEELVCHLRHQAACLSQTGRHLNHSLPLQDGPLLATLPFLQTSFHLLARHAAAVESELAVLEQEAEPQTT